MIKLRNIKLKYLQEFTQTRISVLIFCTAYVGYIVVLGTGQQYYIWGRCFNTMIVIFNFFFFFLLCINIK